MSSANNIISDSEASDKSLTNNKNVRGPIIDPCVTSEITDAHSDFTPLVWIDCFLQRIKDDSQDIMDSEKNINS